MAELFARFPYQTNDLFPFSRWLKDTATRTHNGSFFYFWLPIFFFFRCIYGSIHCSVSRLPARNNGRAMATVDSHLQNNERYKNGWLYSPSGKWIGCETIPDRGDTHQWQRTHLWLVHKRQWYHGCLVKSKLLNRPRADVGTPNSGSITIFFLASLSSGGWCFLWKYYNKELVWLSEWVRFKRICFDFEFEWWPMAV